MAETLASVTLVVRDYDEAIKFFVDALGFKLIEDSDLGNGKRWVVVAPLGGGMQLLLARAANTAQQAAVGNQTGGRVAFFLHTDNFSSTHARFKARGVEFIEN